MGILGRGSAANGYYSSPMDYVAAVFSGEAHWGQLKATVLQLGTHGVRSADLKLTVQTSKWKAYECHREPAYFCE